MGIGTSLGAYFETALDHHAGNETLDQNEYSGEGITHDDTPIPVADFTPLTDKEIKDLKWDTPILSSKDPTWHEGTPEDHIGAMNDILNVTEEESKEQFDSAEKTFGKGNVIPNSPLPVGRVRARDYLPAVKNFKDNLPDDVTVHDMGDGTWVFKKKPSKIDTPMS